MITKAKIEEEVLEVKREQLNEAIVRSDFNLLNPDIIKISRELDVIVLKEMREWKIDVRANRA